MSEVKAPLLKMSTNRVKRQGCAAAAISDASTITDAFMVPQLARACCISSGLKNLRNVCKGMKCVLRGSIRGYTLTLGAEAQPNLDDVIQFLKNVNLHSLVIVFPHEGKLMVLWHVCCCTG